MKLGKTYRLGLMDLNAPEVAVVRYVCGISEARAANFEVIERLDGSVIPDILLINADSPLALAKWKDISQEAEIPAIHFGDHCLKRPVSPLHLLQVLDETIGTLAPPKGVRSPSFCALVVDDSPTARKKMAHYLIEAGGEAVCVDTGEAAIEALRMQRFDMVFLDVALPGTSGYRVCRHIKKNRRTRGLPVILFTGKSSPFDKFLGRLVGCDSYLTKPIKSSVFRETIEKFDPRRTQSGRTLERLDI